MKKSKYFFFSIAVLLLMAQAPTPENLYRPLDMHGYCILNTCLSDIDILKITNGIDTLYLDPDDIWNWSEFLGFNTHLFGYDEFVFQYDSARLEKRPFVTFCFDDGNITDYTIARPIFQAWGEEAVACIVIDWVGDINKMTWAQIESLYVDGWEIASHTITHPPDLTALTLDAARIEIGNSKDSLLVHGFKTKSFIYPGGTSNRKIRSIVPEYYRCARGASGVSDLNPPYNHTLETYALRIVPIDDHTQLSSYITWIDTVNSKKGWLIFIAHTIDSNDSTVIDSLIEYTQSLGISIITLDQGIDSMGNVIEYGDSDEDDAYVVDHRGNLRMGDYIEARYPFTLKAYTDANMFFKFSSGYFYSGNYTTLGSGYHYWSNTFSDSVYINDNLKLRSACRLRVVRINHNLS